MAGQFHLEIVTPTKVYDQGQVDYLKAQGADGSFGVMAGHTPAIMALGIGEIKVVSGSVETFFAATKGFAEITEDGVQLLVESAEPREDIDLSRAQEAFDRAKQLMETKQEEMVDEERALRALERAMNRMKVAKK